MSIGEAREPGNIHMTTQSSKTFYQERISTGLIESIRIAKPKMQLEILENSLATNFHRLMINRYNGAIFYISKNILLK
jgi:hypothetical protein